MKNLDFINGKITTRVGVMFLAAAEKKEKISDVFLKIKGVNSIDQLTRSEIKEIENYIKSYSEALHEKKEPGDITFDFIFRGADLHLGKFSNLDLTIEILELVDSFAPENFQRITVFLACLLAPIVKEKIGSTENIGKIAAELDEVIANQTAFADTVSLYFFFLNLKETSLSASPKSLKTWLGLYHFKMKMSRFSIIISERHAKSYHGKSSKLMTILQNTKFFIKTIWAAMCLWNCALTSSLRQWLQTICINLRNRK